MPFSSISCNAIAVEDIASPSPPTTAACQEKSVSQSSIPRISAENTTWAVPVPKIDRRSFHNSRGFSSSPIRNIRNTTPSSEKCSNSLTFLINPSPHGPIAIPASRYPSTAPMRNRCATGTITTAAARKTIPACSRLPSAGSISTSSGQLWFPQPVTISLRLFMQHRFPLTARGIQDHRRQPVHFTQCRGQFKGTQ